MSDLHAHELIAAVDLGSNSFHLAVAHLDCGQVRLLNTQSQKVQLAADLDQNRVLNQSAMERGLDCLAHFRENLSGVNAERIRVVATNTIRQAVNGLEFSKQASELLGLPVEIISGREEARLIYTGVAQASNYSRKQLVIDIGGGSTELIIGQKLNVLAAESLQMGCISYTKRFFQDGVISKTAWQRAVNAAKQELSVIIESYKALGWQRVIGTSGTIKSLCQIAQFGSQRDYAFNKTHLAELQQTLLRHKHTSQLAIPGLKSDRRNLLPAGLAIVSALFDVFELEELKFCNSALREGVLYELAGRLQHDDIRNHSVSVMQQRYSVDTRQATCVAATCAELAVCLHVYPDQQTRLTEMLDWAAQLHEIGLAIAHASFHKHGSYLLENSEMPGFSQGDQYQLALLVACHRRKLKGDVMQKLMDCGGDGLLVCCALLRIACALNQQRNYQQVPVSCRWQRGKLQLQFADNWLKRHPYAQQQLQDAIDPLADYGLHVSIRHN